MKNHRLSILFPFKELQRKVSWAKEFAEFILEAKAQEEYEEITGAEMTRKSRKEWGKRSQN